MKSEKFVRKVAVNFLSRIGIRSVSDLFVEELIDRTCEAANCNETELTDEDLRIEMRRMIEEITSQG